MVEELKASEGDIPEGFKLIAVGERCATPTGLSTNV
jgi:hypothetical protein